MPPFTPAPTKSLAEQLDAAVTVATSKKVAAESARLAAQAADEAYADAVAKVRVAHEELMKSLGDYVPAPNTLNHRP